MVGPVADALGTMITALSTVLPALAPLFGFEITGETVRQLGGQAAQTIQALVGLAGTIMAIYGRTRAVSPLMRTVDQPPPLAPCRGNAVWVEPGAFMPRSPRAP